MVRQWQGVALVVVCVVLAATPIQAQFWTDDFDDGDISDWTVTTTGNERLGLIDSGAQPGLQRSGTYSVWNWAGGDIGAGSADGVASMAIGVDPQGRQDIVISVWAIMPQPAEWDNEVWFTISYRLNNTGTWVNREFTRTDGWAGWNEYIVPVIGTPGATFEIMISTEVADLAGTTYEVVAFDDVALYERPILGTLVSDNFDDGDISDWTMTFENTDADPANDTILEPLNNATDAHSDGWFVHSNTPANPDGVQTTLSRKVSIPAGQGARFTVWVRQDDDPDNFDYEWIRLAYRLGPLEPWQFRWHEQDELKEQAATPADDGPGMWESYVTDVPLASPDFEVAIVVWNDNTDNQYYFDDVEVVALEAARGVVERTLTTKFVPGIAVPVKLTATPGSGGEIVVTETIPAGLTAENITPSAGTVDVVGQDLVWTVTMGSEKATLFYTVTPPATPSDTYAFVGSHTAGDAWGTLPVTGNDKMANALAAFAKVNFQLAGTEVPAGYLPDYGDRYGDRGNGFAYGFFDGDTGLPADDFEARDRNNPASPDQRWDTLNHTQKPTLPDAGWEIACPNGIYEVYIVGGDSDNQDQYVHWLAEGVEIVNHDCQGLGDNWGEGSGTVTVADGRLTLRNGPNGSNNKICFIDIGYPTPTAPPVDPGNLQADAPSASRILLQWQHTGTEEFGFIVERREGAAGTYLPIAMIDADILTYDDTDVVEGVTYWYRVFAFNGAGQSGYSNEDDATPREFGGLGARDWQEYD